MTFQKQINRKVEVEDMGDTKYYEELYSKKVQELLGMNNENISRDTRRGLRSQYI